MLRASRRSKFMCALVLALRKVPIYGPGSGDAVLGDVGKPTYSVAVTPSEAAAQRDDFAAKKEAKRLVPSKKPDESGPPDVKNSSGKSRDEDITIAPPPGGGSGWAAVTALNTRNVAYDPARDDWQAERDEGATLGGRTSSDTRRGNDVEEARGLQRENSRGRRKREAAGEAPSQQPQGLMLSNVEQRGFTTEADHPTGGAIELPTIRGLSPQQRAERGNSNSPTIPPEFQGYMRSPSVTPPEQPARRTQQGQGQTHPGSQQQPSWSQPPQSGWRQ
ncbi:hypothetical protein GP486_008810 [Trichoglossum hirsutum]|uniref:Uncharacterized protein n=1 Tax=Trichoglossum hirsutum TaxID=265104 RepID=A0A9P8KYH2_9PEZI|nr:hypothetical protein GP486_008810 [Trichoglossum hirsutum]